jgi:hypothetical protein
LKDEDEEQWRESKRGIGERHYILRRDIERVPDLKVSRQWLLVLSVDKVRERS